MATSSSNSPLPERLVRAWRVREPFLRFAEMLGGSGSLQKRARQWIWPDALRHMRVLPPGVRLAADPSRGWTATNRAGALGTTCGLDDVDHRFKGKALIVASGPSAKTIDYDTLPADVKLIAVNGSTEILKRFQRRADLYVATDPDFFRHRMPIVEAAVRGAQHSFLSFAGLAWLAKANPALLTERAARISILEPAGRYYLLRRMTWEELAKWSAATEALTLGAGDSPLAARIGWSDDLRLGVFTGRTVAFTAMQVAAFLGFREIGLIGADFTAGGRAYKEADGARPSKIATDFDLVIKEAFELGRGCCERRGIRIWNLAEASRLQEVFETVSVKEFASDHPPP